MEEDAFVGLSDFGLLPSFLLFRCHQYVVGVALFLVVPASSVCSWWHYQRPSQRGAGAYLVSIHGQRDVCRIGEALC